MTFTSPTPADTVSESLARPPLELFVVDDGGPRCALGLRPWQARLLRVRRRWSLQSRLRNSSVCDLPLRDAIRAVLSPSSRTVEGDG